MKAVIVAVDYSDLLAVTLPYNRHHFDEVAVVTSTADAGNVRPIAASNSAETYVTDAFYARGAAFNKWAALEEALDAVGRAGWICLLDADVLWPRLVPRLDLPIGRLCSPLRRMAPWPLSPLPPEEEWCRYPVHPNVNEHAGYTQIFHASDPVLGEPPWHEVGYRHAGTSDSLFQARWKPADKVRPPFHVLHLGDAGQNWFGRATPDADGSVPPDAEEKRRLTREMWAARRGKSGEDRFRGEKLP